MDATVKNTGYNVKTKNNRSYIAKAYDIGYARGWDDAYNVSKGFGSRIAASYGYRKGIRDHRRADKYLKQYQKQGKGY